MKVKVLFVDDEPNVTAGIRRNLKGQPYDVFCAESANEAMNFLARQEVDVVVSDERMPEMSGADFLTEVREKYPSSVRIMLSGQADLEAVVKAVNEGEIFRFLFKPCRIEELVSTIDQAVKLKELQDRSQWLLQEYRKIKHGSKSGIGDDSGDDAIAAVEFDADGSVLITDESMSLDQIIEEMRKEMS